jgi:hypothetical protein
VHKVVIDAAANHVVPEAAEDLVLPGPAVGIIVPDITFEAIGITTPEQEIVPVPTAEHIRAVGRITRE